VKEARGDEMIGQVVIAELRELDELRELEALFTSIWERPEEPPVNSDILRALAHSGNYVVGARLGNRMVGGLVGWLGGSPAHELHLHSHILGVVAGSQVRGLGFELKQHQRRWCLERGVKVVEWTTDPLVRRNAYFNLNKLGAEAREYLVNFYGVMALRSFSRWVRRASRCRDRHLVASLYARYQRTSSRSGARTRLGRAHGGSRCGKRLVTPSVPVIACEARRGPAGTFSNAAAGLRPALYEGKPGWFSLIAGRFARGCAHSGISNGLI
jgi:GNAT superfamily N-acetyltransferase